MKYFVRAATALVAGAIALGCAATAQAGSIAFVRGGDLWLVTDDGAREHRVTTGENYKWVTQADDGTLFAGEGVTMYRVDQHGRQTAPPISIGTLLDPDVAPDGSKIGYRKYGSAITRAHDKLVLVNRDWDSLGAWKIAYFTNVSSPPRGNDSSPPADPAQRPALRCNVDAGATEPEHPSWSPDGTAIAWEQPDGLHVLPAFDMTTCAQPPGGFTVAGASSPDWGPAAVPTSPTPGPTSGPLRSLSLVKGQKLARVLAKGLRVKVACAAACTATGTLRAGTSTVARGSRRLAAAGLQALTLKVTKSGKRALKRKRMVKLTVDVSAVAAAGARNRQTKALTLRR